MEVTEVDGVLSRVALLGCNRNVVGSAEATEPATDADRRAVGLGEVAEVDGVFSVVALLGCDCDVVCAAAEATEPTDFDRCAVGL